MRITILLCLLGCIYSRSSGQVIDYSVPSGYETEISAADYKKIVDSSVAIVSKRFQVDSVQSGTIHLMQMQDVQNFHLHNLITECIAEKDKNKWSKIIAEHFNKLFITLDEEQKVDPESFKESKPYLSLRLYPKQFITQRKDSRNMVMQTDLEDTYTILMLDLPSGAFIPVPRKNFNHWNKDIAEVFYLARVNIGHQPVQKTKQTINAGGMTIETTTLKNDDYAASYTLDLGANSPELIGEWGAVVSIPNKGIVHVFKISKNKPAELFRFIEKIKPTVDNEYNNHPQQISNQFFWYYKNKFTHIGVSTDNQGKITVTPPAALTSLLNRNK